MLYYNITNLKTDSIRPFETESYRYSYPPPALAGSPGVARRLALAGRPDRLRRLAQPAARLARPLKRLLAICCLLLAICGVACAQSYTYTVGGGQLRSTQDVTLRAGESLYIPTNTVYTGQVTFEGTGQLIVNDWVWIAATVALPAQATLTNNYMLSLEQLTLGEGATVRNVHQCATTALALTKGATVQNDESGWMQVYSEAFTNAGVIRNCGTFLAKSWADGGRVVGCAPLPVKLISFTAEPAAGAVALRWRTAQEVNAARYEVERSTDGLVFLPLSQQPARGAGTYTASDKARPGPQYYRLRLVDADASFSYSPVAVVSGGAALVSRAWYNEIGQRLGAPRPGFLLEVSTYANGAVESRKYWQQ